MQNRNEYLDTVCEQIRFKAARKMIRGEIEAHIDDRIAEGKSEELAIAAMGDAVQTGRALNSVHRPRLEWRVLLCMLLLSAASVFVTVCMTGYGNITFSNSIGALLRPMLAGVCAAAGIYFLNYSMLLHVRYVFYGAALFCAAAYCLFYDLLQPSSVMELLSQTFFFVVCPLLYFIGLIGIIEKYRGRGRKGIIIICVLSVLAIGTTYRIAESCSFMLMIALLSAAVPILGRSKRCINGIIYATLIFAAYVASSMLINYIYHFQSIDFSVDAANSQVADVLKSARLIGPSPFYMSEHAYDLESSHTYYVMTGIIGAYGWLAGLGAALLSGGLYAWMLRRSLQVAHTYGRMLALGISGYFLARFVLAMLTNLGLTESFCSLPFLSFGRFEYLADAVLMGLFLSVWRRSTFMKDEARENAGKASSCFGKIADTRLH